MTPAARVQAAIELLDAILIAAREAGPAADTLIARYFAERRYAGSADRRAIRAHIYEAIRMLGEVPPSGRAAMLAVIADPAERAALFSGGTHGPGAYRPDEPVAEAGIAPAWLVERLVASGLDDRALAAMIARAPLDIRVNRLKAEIGEIAEAIGDAAPIAGLPGGLRLPAGVDVSPWAGQIEVQDAGSQFVTMAADAVPGMKVIDLCAGAGGKSLALAAAMDNRGHILATDVDRGRLGNLAPRARLAGATIIESRLLDPGREAAGLADHASIADLVLIDAPCSGTGTWRRNPEARWRLTPTRLDRLVTTQSGLLEIGAGLVKPGGALVYIVCSLLDAEGADQVARFAAAHRAWSTEPIAIGAGQARGQGIRLTPDHDSTDGFFVARLRRPC